MRVFSWPLVFFLVFTPCLLLASAAVPGPATSHATPVSKVVDKVFIQTKDRAITLRSVQLDDLIEQMNSPKNHLKMMSLDQAKGRASEVLLDFLCEQEGQSFGVKSAEPERASVVLDGLKDFKSFDFQKSEVTDALKRRGVGRQFLDLKAKEMEVVVSANEIQDYYQKNQRQFGEVPLEKVKGTIRDVLVKNQTDEKLRQYFEILKKKYDVHYLVST